MNPQTLAEKLNAAADVIEERGHCRGRLVSSQGGVCLSGAMRTALVGEPDDSAISAEWPKFTHMFNAVQGALGGQNPVTWNDELRNGRFVHGKREAVNLLRRTAGKVLAGASA